MSIVRLSYARCEGGLAMKMTLHILPRLLTASSGVLFFLTMSFPAFAELTKMTCTFDGLYFEETYYMSLNLDTAKGSVTMQDSRGRHSSGRLITTESTMAFQFHLNVGEREIWEVYTLDRSNGEILGVYTKVRVRGEDLNPNVSFTGECSNLSKRRF